MFRFCEGRARVTLLGGATLVCDEAMYAPAAHQSLISFRDLRLNNIQVLTSIRDGEEILELWQGQNCFATASCRASGLYELVISHLLSGRKTIPPSGGFAYSVITPSKTSLWHGRMGHPGATMFRKMLPLLIRHEVCTSDANKVGACEAYAQGKLILKPSYWKLLSELPPLLQQLQGEICGPITLASGPFRYFLVLVFAARVHFEVSLLSTQNIAFAKILASLLKFRIHYPDYPVKTFCMDNAKEFRSQKFEDYCVATGILLAYAIPYEHAQNGLAEAFIKKIQLISRLFLLHAKLPSSFWSYAMLHTATLLRYRPTLLNEHSPLEIMTGRPPDVFHFRTFGYRVWVPIFEPERKTIGSHCQEGIYIGFDSPSVIRYVSPKTGTLHKAQFQNC